MGLPLQDLQTDMQLKVLGLEPTTSWSKLSKRPPGLRLVILGFWWKLFSRKISCYFFNYKSTCWASLVAQWLRIHLPMQGTRVQALVWEDPTCRRATKPTRHNYRACALEPASHNCWVRVLQLLKPMHIEPLLRNKRSHRNEKPAHRNRV